MSLPGGDEASTAGVADGSLSDPAHFDLVLARASNTKVATASGFGSGQSDWGRQFHRYLILHLSDLIKTASMASTSPIESHRQLGIVLMDEVLRLFSASKDPEMEGHSLLEQYQAQITSSSRQVRTPLSPLSPLSPSLTSSLSHFSHLSVFALN
jgi:hypothetical protein